MMPLLSPLLRWLLFQRRRQLAELMMFSYAADAAFR